MTALTPRELYLNEAAAELSRDPPFPTLHPRAGEKIVTDYWRKPGPTNAFDWSAHFDNDEPNDDGQMSVGYGATEQDAIDDLLMTTEDA